MKPDGRTWIHFTPACANMHCAKSRNFFLCCEWTSMSPSTCTSHLNFQEWGFIGNSMWHLPCTSYFSPFTAARGYSVKFCPNRIKFEYLSDCSHIEISRGIRIFEDPRALRSSKTRISKRFECSNSRDSKIREKGSVHLKIPNACFSQHCCYLCSIGFWIKVSISGRSSLIQAIVSLFGVHLLTYSHFASPTFYILILHFLIAKLWGSRRYYILTISNFSYSQLFFMLSCPLPVTSSSTRSC